MLNENYDDNPTPSLPDTNQAQADEELDEELEDMEESTNLKILRILNGQIGDEITELEKKAKMKRNNHSRTKWKARRYKAIAEGLARARAYILSFIPK